MNAETIYTCAAEIIRNAIFRDGNGTPEGNERMYNKIINRPGDWINALEPIASAARIMVQAREAMDTKTTSAGKLAALKRVLKSAPEYLQGQYKQGERWYMLDGLRLYSSAEKFPETIPELPGRGEAHFNAVKFLDEIRAKWHEYRPAPETVTRAAVKEYKARPENKPQSKHGSPRPYIIEEPHQNTGVNAEYLLDLMTLYPEAVIMISGQYSPIVAAVDGEPVAVVMPVRVTQPRKEESAA